MSTELKPLFIWQRLTGETLYKMHNPNGDWRKVLGKGHWEGLAKDINKMLCLCAECGARVPLNQNGTCDGGCEDALIQRYAELLRLDQEDGTQTSLRAYVERKEMEEQAVQRGYKFVGQDDGSVWLASLEVKAQ